MQPIQHLLLLTHTRIPKSILAVFTTAMTEGDPTVFFGALAVVGFFPAASNEEYITDFDVAALGCGTNVNALMETALTEVFP
jgi:hypothetical protein